MKTYSLTLVTVFHLLANLASAQQTVSPSADGYIYLAGEKMNQSFGTGDTLLTRYTRKGETTAQTFIRFDLAESGSFNKVIFNIYGKSNQTKSIDVYSAFGQWTDQSLKGSEQNKPSRVSYIGTFEVTDMEKYQKLDITPYFNYIRSIGKKDITLVLVERELQSDAANTQFHSRSHPSGKTPFLYFENGNAPVRRSTNFYYIDSRNGDDNSTGTSPAAAWKTLKKAASVFLNQGDQVLLKRGSLFKESLFLKIIPSSASITKIGAYGQGNKPIIDPEGRESFALMFFNTPYLEVEELEITHTASDIPSIRRGIYYQAEDMGEVNHVRFKNLYVHDIIGNKGKEDGDLFAKRNAGLSLEITGNNIPTYMNDYRVEGSRFYRISRHGAVNQSSWSQRTFTKNTNWVPSKNIVISNNVFEETASNGLIVRVADGPLIQYNLFKKCSRELSGNACFSFNTDNALWQYNEACYTSYNTGDLDGAGFDSDFKSKNTIFQFNYAHHNEYGDMLITGGPSNFGGFNDSTIVRYNVFYNNGHHGIRISGGATNTIVYNNVIYKDKDIITPTDPYNEYETTRLFYTRNWGGWPKNAVYTNNIYYYDHTSIPASSDLNPEKSPGSVFYNNIVYASKSDSSLSLLNALRVNPLIRLPVNKKDWDGLLNMKHFQVQPGSPAINAGKSIAHSVDKDFKGTRIPAKQVDIGAFERAQ